MFFKCLKEIKNIFTRVLKGHIAVALSNINKEKNGHNIDKIARKVLILLALIIVMELDMELEHF